MYAWSSKGPHSSTAICLTLPRYKVLCCMLKSCTPLSPWSALKTPKHQCRTSTSTSSLHGVDALNQHVAGVSRFPNYEYHRSMPDGQDDTQRPRRPSGQRRRSFFTTATATAQRPTHSDEPTYFLREALSSAISASYLIAKWNTLPQLRMTHLEQGIYDSSRA